ncbi:hypothetical protein M413DRAFT_439604 [Hebeloma cylindrosporum]|uniref:Uncharacterized protein n=1 Tax=Hebeloma cylindrosporum TaxID=76867 RepID=A0A0C2Z3V2_HEBCY|nr:hypothetical protein M413DRAFT_439604 [Hebeloma cylindrosporum h7]
MDELVHHCLREIAFDGNLGSGVARLKDFIVDFYAHASHPQIPDDAFCAFVWSLVVQQPTIIMGLLDPSIKSQVWIAPQVSSKRKAIANGTDRVESRPPTLEPVPQPKTTPVEQLREIYGDRLRLAVDPEAIFAAVTDSHIRSSKMSPMVYSALQIITRGRDAGVTVVELGKQSGYDQKTCFYLVRQLTELGLVMKVRRGGVGTHFCLHKYFFERNSSWKAIRDEEDQAANAQAKDQGNSIRGMDKFPEDDTDTEDSDSLNFTPIDARHLSSLPLISARVIRLLKASKNRIHASNNMLITLGFSNPNKTDRRFFQSRIREMIQQRLIEKVVVPSNKKKSPNTSVKCFRLVSKSGDAFTPLDTESISCDQEEDDIDDVTLGQNGIKLNTTIHKQIVDLLDESGISGMTLNELSSSLCHFDKRTIELLLARADKVYPPTHLSDLRLASIMETHGRERRHRYFTVANYRKLVAQEELDKNCAGYADTDLDNVGGFLPISTGLFYDTETSLVQYLDAFNDTDKTRYRKPKKPPKNPILPDGKTKRGRPRKNPAERESLVTESIQKNKRKRAEVDETSTQGFPTETPDEPTKKRPRLRTEVEEQSVPKRGRGRPPKLKDTDNVLNSPKCLTTTSKERGRPRNLHNGSEPLESSGASPVEQPENDTRDIIVSLPEPNELTEKTSTIRQRGRHGSRSPHSSPVLDNTDTMAGCEGSVGTNVTLEIVQDKEIESTDSQVQALDFEPSTAVNVISTPTSGLSRVNVSHLRRENELIRLVGSAGGIVNVQTREFYDEHTRLLESLADAGEPTSAPPGTRTDKRTMSSTFSNLEKKGRVKQLKTSIITPTGLNRPATIVYLPHIDQGQLNSFLADLARVSQVPASQFTSFVKIDQKLEYGASSTPSSRGNLPLQLLQLDHHGKNEKERWSKNTSRANQLFTYEDSTIREVFLAERTTIAQTYGFIVGKAIRCRELHLSAIRGFETGNPSPNILSHEKKIIDLSFFCQDLPLDTYCSLVSPLGYDEDLLDFLGNEETRKTVVRDLPPNLQTALNFNRTRPRSRILDLLEILRCLGLVSPLRLSSSGTPFLTYSPIGQPKMSFELAPLDGWTSNTPMLAPIHWHFHESIPIYLWALSESQPPYWKTVEAKCTADALALWEDFREACLNPDNRDNFHQMEKAQTIQNTASGARSLRRAASWRSGYFLTWHQTQYLKQYINASSGATPLQNPNEIERRCQLNKLCWVTSAPHKAVEGFFISARGKILKALERTKEKAKKTQERADETKLSLAKKAEEARKQREQEWIALLLNTHPEMLTGPSAIRVERIRSQFLQAGSTKDVSRWEKEIQAALREADLASSKALKISTKRAITAKPIPTNSNQPQTLSSPLETSIQNLIELQGPPQYNAAKRKGKKARGLNNEELQKPPRRHRFQWNPEFDELARDASVIIRARCRNMPRLDWAAFEQVFPTVPRNTVRQRLSHIKETPGNEAYLRRLEDTWYELWLKYRGTAVLPDGDYQSPSQFDLVKHIEFLRANLDKNALRVGLAHATERTNILIPSDIDAIRGQFDAVEPEKTAPEWDFIWNTLIEEGREKKMKGLALARCKEDFVPGRASISDDLVLAEGALKMVMGTPHELYDTEHGSSVLRSRGDEAIHNATKSLLFRGVLSKLQRDPLKQGPGRQLKISESNQNATGGNIARDTFQDAVSLLEAIDPNDKTWHDWPLTATDGDCATLIELASEDKVDFAIDTSLPQSARPALDWNSKKADDDQIETAIAVRYCFAGEGQEQTVSAPQTTFVQETEDFPKPGDGGPGHGINIDNNAACCREMASHGLGDCLACLDEAWATFSDTLDPENRNDAIWILDTVRQTKEVGVRKSDLLASAGPRASRVPFLINQLIEAEVPQLYWTGYDSLVLTTAQHVAKWSVVVSKSPLINEFPRRWLDIKGTKIADFWQAALRAVMGLVIFRPGITQAEIRWRLRSVYDRQEVNEIVRFLQTEGYLAARHVHTSVWTECGIYAPFDEEEESQVYWFIGDKHWYQV